MASNFVSQDYIAAIQTLLDRQSVGVRVCGLMAGELKDKLANGPFAEWFFERFDTEQVGAPGMLDGVLTAGLKVVRQLDDDEAESQALELAIDVATSLVDENEDPEVPAVMKGGPILVKSIDPVDPGEYLSGRCAAFVIMYEQEFRFVRSNVKADAPASYTKLYAAQDPSPVDADDVSAFRELYGD